MTLVPRQRPHVLASTHVGHLSRHANCIGHGFYGHDNLGGNDLFVLSADILGHEEGEPIVAPADALDGAHSSYENVWNSEQLQHSQLLAHVDGLHSRPREDLSWSAASNGSASTAVRYRTELGSRGFQGVNPDGCGVRS